MDLCGNFNQASTTKIATRNFRKGLIKYGMKGCKTRLKPWFTEVNIEKRLLWIKITRVEPVSNGRKSYGLMKVTMM